MVRAWDVFCTFWLRNVLRATTACTFSTSQLPKVVRALVCVCTLLLGHVLRDFSKSKCAERHKPLLEVERGKTHAVSRSEAHLPSKSVSRAPCSTSLTCRKSDAVVARSTFSKVKALGCGPFLKLRCWKRFSTLWREAHLELKMLKTQQCSRQTSFSCTTLSTTHSTKWSTATTTSVLLLHFQLRIPWLLQLPTTDNCSFLQVTSQLPLQVVHDNWFNCSTAFWLPRNYNYFHYHYNLQLQTTNYTYNIRTSTKWSRTTTTTTTTTLHCTTLNFTTPHVLHTTLNGVHFDQHANHSKKHNSNHAGPSVDSLCHHFDLEMCFAPQRRALFRHLNFQKWTDAGVLCTFWLRRCAWRHNGVHFFDISTSKSGPDLVCFVHFDFKMCFRATVAEVSKIGNL